MRKFKANEAIFGLCCVMSAAAQAEECEVWAREQSFARSAAEVDASAFVEHVAEDAVFDVGGAAPARGRDAIVARWAGILAGKQVRPRWYPTHVALSETGHLAWSTGPVLIEDLDPAAAARYRRSTFRSVWRKDPDGAWRVLFDDGGEPEVATAKDVQAFEHGRKDCGA